MSTNPDTDQGPDPATEREHRGRLYALEICFLAFIGVVVLIFFSQALTYKIVSSRTPFVIMVPLIALIAVHARRLWRVRGEFRPFPRIRAAFYGQTREVNAVFGISAWMALLVLMVEVIGHVAGIFIFCVILMRFLAKESWTLTLLVAILSTLFIYGVFEYAFGIELYRGLIIRYFLGFRDF